MRKNKNDNLMTARAIAQAVATAGGRAYYVGGCVRDKLMGRPFTDIDIEVHALHADELERILSDFGEVLTVGKSFGIFTLRSCHLDIALPRKERLVGNGHRDFDVEVDPFIGTLAAAKRRDFTVCAMMEDILTGELIDHFHGRQDLERGILRHVDDTTFGEDALRVLRGAQFIARFNFEAAPETVNLCKSIDLSALPKERVMEELSKALLSAERPSLFFEFLRQVGQLSPWFAELKTLIGVEQNPTYHAEGDVWNHTMMVLDQAAKLRDKAKHPLYFMLAALTHDLGKPLATRVIDGRIRSYNHEKLGLPPAKDLLSRLTGENELRRYVLNMISLHMRPHQLAAQNSSLKASHKLFDRSVCPEDLCLLAQADNLGRLPLPEADYGEYLSARLAAYKELMSRPRVMGKDLIEAGLSPQKNFHLLLEFAHKQHLTGADKQEVLRRTLAYANTLKENTDDH